MKRVVLPPLIVGVLLVLLVIPTLGSARGYFDLRGAVILAAFGFWLVFTVGWLIWVGVRDVARDRRAPATGDFDEFRAADERRSRKRQLFYLIGSGCALVLAFMVHSFFNNHQVGPTGEHRLLVMDGLALANLLFAIAVFVVLRLGSRQ